MYINDTTQEQKTHGQLRTDNPTISVPADGIEIIVLVDEWWLIHDGTPPPYDPDTQKLEVDVPVKTDVYRYAWDAVALTQQEMDDNLASAKNNKYDEIWDYANSRIDAVEENSSSDKNTKKAKKLSDMSQKRLIKKSNGGILTPQEEADEEWYDTFLDWEDSTNDVADLSEDAVEAMSLPSVVNAYDVTSPTPPYPDFVAP